jgi:hypothetical protein
VQSHNAKRNIPASHVYGGGDAGEKIAALLSTLPLKFHKTIAY